MSLLTDLQPGEQPPSVPEEKNISVPPDQPRLLSLDVLRGKAVLGALLVSIWWFGGFSNNQQNNLLLHPSGGNYRLYATISLLLEGKMRALIALVFGAGIILLLARSAGSKLSVADQYIRRHIWLIIFGLLNGLVFLWSGDLLFHLGIMGILLFPFARLSQRGLLIAGTICLLCFVGKNYWRFADDKKVYKKYLVVAAVEKKFKKDSSDKKQPGIAATPPKDTLAKAAKKDTLTTEQKKDKDAWEGLVKGMKYDPKKDDGENKAMRKESYGKLWNHLVQNTEFREAAWLYRYGLWELASMIFFGMALFKMGFFSGHFSKGTYALLAITGIAVGLLLGWFRLYFNNATLLDYAKYIDRHGLPYNLFAPIERAAIAIGYASAVMLVIGWGWVRNAWRIVATVGRMALTNYLLQSIFCTLFFTGYGMTYFGKLVQWELYVVVGEIWLVQIVISIVWLRHFAYGPAEWLWRWLSSGERPPFRLDKTVTPEQIQPAVS